MFKHVLFDLDGTLTRSHVGILRSVEYALNREGESTVDRLRQEVVIGRSCIHLRIRTDFQQTKLGVCTIIFRNDTVR